MAPPFVVRRFADGEAEALRRLRLDALADTPSAFGVSLEQDAARPLAFWQGWIREAPPFGAFIEGVPCGLAGFWQNVHANLAHRGSLGAMYVAPSLRGSGAAAAIVAAVVDHARTRVEQLHLSVTAGNDRAERFYRRLDFREYGREPGGLRYAGRDHDVLLMVLNLAPKGG